MMWVSISSHACSVTLTWLAPDGRCGVVTVWLNVLSDVKVSALPAFKLGSVLNCTSSLGVFNCAEPSEQHRKAKAVTANVKGLCWFLISYIGDKKNHRPAPGYLRIHMFYLSRVTISVLQIKSNFIFFNFKINFTLLHALLFNNLFCVILTQWLTFGKYTLTLDDGCVCSDKALVWSPVSVNAWFMISTSLLLHMTLNIM